ncbi:MAG: hypothetical protein ACJA1A_001431 [Saprospiraceae bacterium]|jgi:hypothetical protein
MNLPNIATASIFPRLKGILSNDIVHLTSVISKIRNDDKLVDFLESLISAKKHIISELPGEFTDIYQGSPNVPQKEHLTGYELTDLESTEDSVKLLSLLLSTEESQLELVKNASDTKGLPEELETKLVSLSRNYAAIVDQIGRSKKTQQFGTIVL